MCRVCRATHDYFLILTIFIYSILSAFTMPVSHTTLKTRGRQVRSLHQLQNFHVLLSWTRHLRLKKMFSKTFMCCGRLQLLRNYYLNMKNMNMWYFIKEVSLLFLEAHDALEDSNDLLFCYLCINTHSTVTIKLKWYIIVYMLFSLRKHQANVKVNSNTRYGQTKMSLRINGRRILWM